MSLVKSIPQLSQNFSIVYVWKGQTVRTEEIQLRKCRQDLLVPGSSTMSTRLRPEDSCPSSLASHITIYAIQTDQNGPDKYHGSISRVTDDLL